MTVTKIEGITMIITANNTPATVQGRTQLLLLEDTLVGVLDSITNNYNNDDNYIVSLLYLMNKDLSSSLLKVNI